MAGSTRDEVHADLWFIAQRWRQYEGEHRANGLRITAVGGFYLVHLLNYYQPFDLFQLAGQGDPQFHRSVTVLAVAWTMLAVGVELCLRQRIFPRLLPFWTTGCDLLLLTAVLCVGGGQRSPLVLAYLLIIVLAGLRVSLPLIRCATVGALAGYLFVMAFARWSDSFGLSEMARVPRYSQVMTLLAIALCGIILGQLIRGVRSMAEEFSDRMMSQPTTPPASGNDDEVARS